MKIAEFSRIFRCCWSRVTFDGVDTWPRVAFFDDYGISLVFDRKHTVDNVTNVGEREILEEFVSHDALLQEIVWTENNSKMSSDKLTSGFRKATRISSNRNWFNLNDKIRGPQIQNYCRYIFKYDMKIIMYIQCAVGLYIYENSI